MIYDWIVIGGGASGLMFAAMKKINNGIILESTDKSGNKLLLTGGGRCNLTHAGSIKDFIQCYGDSGKVLRKILYKYNNLEMIKFFESNGFSLVCEDERYYPASMKASDVRDFLLKKALSNGWQIKYNSKVKDIDFKKPIDAEEKFGEEATISVSNSTCQDFYRVMCSDDEYCGRNIVIASGGITYPHTGSDGSMFRILEKSGINIIHPRSALAPVHIANYPYSDLAGISIKDVRVSVINSNEKRPDEKSVLNANDASKSKAKKINMTGDLLFTHTGFSGPAILNISRHIEAGDEICISYNKTLEELPRRFRKILEDRARNDSGEIKEKTLEKFLKADIFIIEKIDPNGIITAGGIDLDEINIQDMSLKKFSNVYVVGEVIDADGISGGYNLQLCYSTAAVVGGGWKCEERMQETVKF